MYWPLNSSHNSNSEADDTEISFFQFVGLDTIERGEIVSIQLLNRKKKNY